MVNALKVFFFFYFHELFTCVVLINVVSECISSKLRVNVSEFYHLGLIGPDLNEAAEWMCRKRMPKH